MSMLTKKFVMAAIVAIAAPILVLLPWISGSHSTIWLVYVTVTSLIGIIVGAFIYSRVGVSSISSVISFFVSALVAWIMVAFVLPQTAGGDAYPAAIWALMFYMAVAAVTGFVFGSGIGQTGNRPHQQQ